MEEQTELSAIYIGKSLYWCDECCFKEVIYILRALHLVPVIVSVTFTQSMIRNFLVYIIV